MHSQCIGNDLLSIRIFIRKCYIEIIEFSKVGKTFKDDYFQKLSFKFSDIEQGIHKYVI